MDINSSNMTAYNINTTFLSTFNVHSVYFFVVIADSIFGIIGNIFIIGAVACTKELHTPLNVLIFNLALSDFCISLLVDPFIPIGILYGEVFFEKKNVLCAIVASSTVVASISSLASMLLLALNRYLFICNKKLYRKYFKWNYTIRYCFMTWIIGIIADLPNFIIWSHIFDKKSLNCTWNRLANRIYNIVLITFTIVVPTILIFYFYLRIFIYALMSKTRIQQRKQKLKVSMRISKGLFCSFIIFSICWTPFGSIIILDGNDEFSYIAYICSIMLATLNSSLNPILYALTNSQFKRGYQNLIYFVFNRQKYSYTRNDKLRYSIHASRRKSNEDNNKRLSQDISSF